jgi:hypothetical protein
MCMEGGDNLPVLLLRQPGTQDRPYGRVR